MVAAGLSCRCWGVGAKGDAGAANLRRAAAAGAAGATVDWPVIARDMFGAVGPSEVASAARM